MTNVPTRQTAMLIAQRIKPGLEADFRRWEVEITAAARQCLGFQGVQHFAPVPGLQEDWVVLLRFDTPTHLREWLDSDRHKELLAAGQELFSQAQTQVIMVAPQSSDLAPVTCIISSRVSPDRAEEFKAWQQKLEAQQRQFAGYLGSETFPPVTGVTEDWTIMFRFDSDENLEKWLQSDLRVQSLKESDADFQRFELKKVSSSFAGWFPPPTPSTPLPPDWAQALVVVMALYPIAMISALATQGLLQGFPLSVGMFINNVIGTIVLTWVGMPLVNKVMRWWLYPEMNAPDYLKVLGVASILFSYALMVGLFTLLG